MAGFQISLAVFDPVRQGVVTEVAAVLLGLTGDVSVRAVAVGDCSNCCHDVFGGEQSDASCCVRHGGLRYCWRLMLHVGGYAQSGAVELSCPLGPWRAKLVVNVLWWAVLLGQQKGRLNQAALSGSFLPCRCSVAGGLYGMHWLATDWSVLSCSHWSSVAPGGFGRRVYWRWKVGKCGVVRACWHCLLLCPWDGFVMPNLFLLTGRGTGANAIDWRGRCCLCRRPCKYVLLFVSDTVVHWPVLGSGFLAPRLCWPARLSDCQGGVDSQNVF